MEFCDCQLNNLYNLVYEDLLSLKPTCSMKFAKIQNMSIYKILVKNAWSSISKVNVN